MPRVHERVDFLAQIELDSASGMREVRVTDISEGGCYIDSIVSVRVDDPLKFDIVHPNGGRLSFTGAVAYHFDGVGFGVRFTDITEEQRLFLSRIVRT